MICICQVETLQLLDHVKGVEDSNPPYTWLFDSRATPGTPSWALRNSSGKKECECCIVRKRLNKSARMWSMQFAKALG